MKFSFIFSLVTLVACDGGSPMPTGIDPAAKVSTGIEVRITDQNHSDIILNIGNEAGDPLGGTSPGWNIIKKRLRWNLTPLAIKKAVVVDSVGQDTSYISTRNYWQHIQYHELDAAIFEGGVLRSHVEDTWLPELYGNDFPSVVRVKCWGYQYPDIADLVSREDRIDEEGVFPRLSMESEVVATEGLTEAQYNELYRYFRATCRHNMDGNIMVTTVVFGRFGHL